MAGHSPHESPSETMSAPMSSSRVMWKGCGSHHPSQNWSKSRPKTFHRDDRVPFKASMEDKKKTPDVSWDDASLKGSTSVQSSARGRASHVFGSNSSALTQRHLDRHVRRSGTASCKPEGPPQGHYTMEEWELMLVSEGKQRLTECFNTLNSQRRATKDHSTGDMATVSKGAQETLQGCHGALPASAEEEAEEELIARFYEDQKARCRKQPPQLGNEPLSQPSLTRAGNPTPPNFKLGDQTHARNPSSVASLFHTPHLPQELAVRDYKKSATESAANTTVPETSLRSRQKYSGDTIATLEEFRLQVLQQKLQRCTEINKANTTPPSDMPHTLQNSPITTSTDTKLQLPNHDKTQPNTIHAHLFPSMPTTAATVYEIIHNSKEVKGTAIPNNITLQQVTLIFQKEARSREDIERAEEAGRLAALEAMQSGATAIASAEALGLTEERGREDIERAEEAGRLAALEAMQSGA
ncbi:hypothetical protein TraAM80_03301, partial [Trypanosoma rangeli]